MAEVIGSIQFGPTPSRDWLGDLLFRTERLRSGAVAYPNKNANPAPRNPDAKAENSNSFSSHAPDPGYFPDPDVDIGHPNSALDQLANHRRDLRGGGVEAPQPVDGERGDVRVPRGFAVRNEAGTQVRHESVPQADLTPGAVFSGPGAPFSYGGTE